MRSGCVFAKLKRAHESQVGFLLFVAVTRAALGQVSIVKQHFGGHQAVVRHD